MAATATASLPVFPALSRERVDGLQFDLVEALDGLVHAIFQHLETSEEYGSERGVGNSRRTYDVLRTSIVSNYWHLQSSLKRTMRERDAARKRVKELEHAVAGKDPSTADPGVTEAQVKALVKESRDEVAEQETRSPPSGSLGNAAAAVMAAKRLGRRKRIKVKRCGVQTAAVVLETVGVQTEDVVDAAGAVETRNAQLQLQLAALNSEVEALRAEQREQQGSQGQQGQLSSLSVSSSQNRSFPTLSSPVHPFPHTATVDADVHADSPLSSTLLRIRHELDARRNSSPLAQPRAPTASAAGYVPAATDVSRAVPRL